MGVAIARVPRAGVLGAELAGVYIPDGVLPREEDPYAFDDDAVVARDCEILGKRALVLLEPVLPRVPTWPRSETCCLFPPGALCFRMQTSLS